MSLTDIDRLRDEYRRLSLEVEMGSPVRDCYPIICQCLLHAKLLSVKNDLHVYELLARGERRGLYREARLKVEHLMREHHLPFA